jgi:hypothetical protein
MRAELVLMGKRVDMARQARRRWLAVAIYVALALLIAGLWYFTHWRGSLVFIVWALLLACRLFLGGYYRGGLVKPFSEPHPRAPQMPSPLLAIGLRVYNSLPEDDRAFLNDEREVHQRDRAHYVAYQAIGVAVMVQAFLASIRVHHLSLQAWMGIAADEFYCGLAVVTLTMFLTLPQAILLWTEPDMEDAG